MAKAAAKNKLTEIQYGEDDHGKLLSVQKSDNSNNTLASSAAASSANQTSPMVMQYKEVDDEE